MKKNNTKKIILFFVIGFVVGFILIVLAIFTDIFPVSHDYCDTVEEVMELFGVKDGIDTIYVNEGAIYIYIDEDQDISTGYIASKLIKKQIKYYPFERAGYDIESVKKSENEPILGTYSEVTRERKTKLLYGWKNQDGKEVHVNDELATQKDFSITLHGKAYDLSLWYIEIDLDEEVKDIKYIIKE